MKFHWKAAAIFPLLAACGADLPTTTPTTAPSPNIDPTPATSITFTLKTPSKITRILLIDRAWADVLKTSQLTSAGNEHATAKDPFVYEAIPDATPPGSYHVPGLLPGRTYDLLLWTQDAAGHETRWEGAAMDYHRPIKPAEAATPEDRKAIEALITDPPQFYDKVRVLRIAADHQHATVLVELLRTRDFHSDAGGEVIYRTELWYFENLFGGWAKDKNTEKVLARTRGKPDALPENWQFPPELGGLTPGAEPPTITLPEKPDPKHGLVGRISAK